MDWLEEKFFGEHKSIGMSDTDARLLARIRARIKRDESLRQAIQNGGFDGFCSWVEIHCKDIYYDVKVALKRAWEWLKSQF